jgi:hypothetical protein
LGDTAGNLVVTAVGADRGVFFDGRKRLQTHLVNLVVGHENKLASASRAGQTSTEQAGQK